MILEQERRKIDTIKAQLRSQEAKVKQLEQEASEDYDDYMLNLLRREIPTTIDPVTGKRVEMFPGLKEQLEEKAKQKKQQENKSRRLIGYAGSEIVNGKLIQGAPIYADNETEEDIDMDKKKKRLVSGFWS
jgi:hypothetical protein